MGRQINVRWWGEIGVQKASGGAKVAIKGAKLTLGGEEKIWEYKSSRGRNKPIRKTKKKWRHFLFFLDSEIFVLCRGVI